MRCRQSPLGVLKRASAHLVERIREGSVEPEQSGWDSCRKEESIAGRGWRRQPGSRLSRQVPGCLREKQVGKMAVSPPLAGPAHCLSCPGGTLL